MSFEVEYFTLNTTDSSNRFISLDGTPLSSDNVAMDIISGTAQLWCAGGVPDGSCDFGVDGTSIRWDNTGFNLYSYLTAGDKLRVIYDKS